MCYAAIPYVIMAVAAVAKGYSDKQTAKAEKRAAQIQEDTATHNAQVEETRAQDAEKRGKIAEGQQRVKEESILGAQRARFAAGGLSLAEGSPLNILETTMHTSDIDLSTIRDNTAKEAWALRESANNFKSNANLWHTRGDSINPNKQFTLSLLGGAGSVSSAWSKGNS